MWVQYILYIYMTPSANHACVPTKDALLLAQERDAYAARNPQSRRHYVAAARVLPGGTTRSVLHAAPFPLAVASGRGALLADLDGHTYIDFLGDFSSGLLGHSDERLLSHVQRTLSATGLSLGAAHPAERRLAEVMCERFGLEQVRFTNSGTEANLMALTCALMWQRRRAPAAPAAPARHKILVFDGSYHGSVLNFKRGHASWNAPYAFLLARYNDPVDTRRVIREHASQLAAVLVEPMLGSMGCLPGERGFLESLCREAHAAGALVIADEVQTSRHGESGMLAQVTDEEADLRTYGKYIGGGFSFGALGGKADIMRLFAVELPHGGTFNNNVASMSAGCVVLGDIFTPAVARAHTARGERFRRRVHATLSKYRVPVRVSGHGSAMCLHATAAAPNTVDEIRRGDDVVRELVVKGLLRRGVYIGMRGQINLGLAHSEADADAVLAALDDTLRDLERRRAEGDDDGALI